MMSSEAVANGDLTMARMAEAVVSLLRRQVGLYERLEQFADRQRSFVSREDTQSLLSLLADRQRISTELTEISGRLEPVRRDWSTFKHRMDANARAEAEALWSESKARLKRVLDRDEEDARVLAARKELVGRSLQSARSSADALGAYRGKSAAGAPQSRLDEGA